METLIRPPGDADRDDWSRLFSAYADFYRTPITGERMDAVWGWIVDPKAQFWCALAFVDGRAVGLVQYQAMFRSLAGGETCYLSDLYVDPEVRGNYIGLRLVQHVRDFAARSGYADVRLLTHETNATARRLYDGLAPPSGFILYRFGPEGSPEAS